MKLLHTFARAYGWTMRDLRELTTEEIMRLQMEIRKDAKK